MHDEGVGSEALERGHRHRQRLVLDVDEFDRVRGRRHRLGHDDHDRFTDETHDVAREQRAFDTGDE